MLAQSWLLSFTIEAEIDFKKLKPSYRAQVYKKLAWLAKNFNIITPLPLTGPWQGFFKLRLGNLRIIYKADYQKSLIVIYVIGQRDKIYKQRR